MTGVISGFLQGEGLKASMRAEEEARIDRERKRNMQDQMMAKQQRIDSSIAEGNARALMAEGAAGLEAAGMLQQYEAQQQQQQLSQYKSAFKSLMALPEAQRAEGRQFLVGSAVANNLMDEGTADQYSFLAQEDPAAFDAAVANLLGEEPERVTSKFTTFTNDKGERIRLDLNNPEDIKAAKSLGKDWKEERAVQRVEEGKPGEFDLPKKERVKLKNDEVAVKQAIAAADSLLDKLEANPDVLQTAAKAAGALAGFSAEIESAARAFGVDIPAELKDEALYADTFEALGIEDAAARGAALDLALSYAAASGLGTGRALTDRDIERAFDRIGAGGLQTPEARKRVIEDNIGS